MQETPAIRYKGDPHQVEIPAKYGREPTKAIKAFAVYKQQNMIFPENWEAPRVAGRQQYPGTPASAKQNSPQLVWSLEEWSAALCKEKEMDRGRLQDKQESEGEETDESK